MTHGITLWGNQRVVSSLAEVCKVSEEDTIDEKLYHQYMGKEKSDKAGINFFFDHSVVEYDYNGNTIKRKEVYPVINAACHAKLRAMTQETTFLFNTFDKTSFEAQGQDTLLYLFSEDSPFNEVTRDVTFIFNEHLHGVVFRNMKVPVKILTNLMIWTRQIYVFRNHEATEGWDLPVNVRAALLPTIQKNGVFPVISTGDYPTYSNSNYCYHPNDFLNWKKLPQLKSFDRSFVGYAQPNPCNHFLSIRKVKKTEATPWWRTGVCFSPYYGNFGAVEEYSLFMNVFRGKTSTDTTKFNNRTLRQAVLRALENNYSLYKAFYNE